jgi:hypothetical protein
MNNTLAKKTHPARPLTLAQVDAILREYNSPAGMAKLAGAMLSGGIPNTKPVQSNLKEYFGPGVYIRECYMPMNSIIVGKQHRTEHFNIIKKGAARYIDDAGNFCTVRAGGPPFISKAGRQKLLVVMQDCVWLTIHPTTETDPEKLAELLIDTEATKAAMAEAAKYTGEKLALPSAP